MGHSYLFTSESVSEGHPDKIADQISDAVLDAILSQDARARVACETLVKTGMVLVAGEVTTSAWVDIEDIARRTVLGIGYNDSGMGFDGASCAHASCVCAGAITANNAMKMRTIVLRFTGGPPRD